MRLQRLKRMGFKKNRVSSMLSINQETVTKYWNMSPDEYDALKKRRRNRKPDIYKHQIVEWLKEFPDMPATQIYDWLKERSPLETLDFEKRSFQNYIFVIGVFFMYSLYCDSNNSFISGAMYLLNLIINISFS